MKNIILLLLTFGIFQFGIAQVNPTLKMSSKIKSGTIQLYYGDMKISYVKAKEMSLDKGKTQAFEFFKKAKSIRNWDNTWIILGGISLGNLLVTPTVTNLLITAGINLIPYLPSRRKQFSLYTKNAIEAFNSEKSNSTE